MSKNNLKDKWNNVDEYSDIPEFDNRSIEQFLSNRSVSIYEKIRRILITDLVVKSVSGILILLDLLIYHDTYPVIYVITGLLLLLLAMFWLEVKVLQKFNKAADPGQTTRDNLSAILIFLKRRFTVPLFTIASTQVLIFVPGLLLYFFLVYGHIKPITPLSYFVFCFLCLIGTVVSFLYMKSQVGFNIRHLNLCLSDMNDSILAVVADNIEAQRKQDSMIKVLVGLLLIFGFVILLAVLKSIVS